MNPVTIVRTVQTVHAAWEAGYPHAALTLWTPEHEHVLRAAVELDDRAEWFAEGEGARSTHVR